MPKQMVKGVGSRSCTRRDHRFCIPTCPLRRFEAGQHPSKFSLICWRSRRRCHLVFVLVAFPPPPVTFPATRLAAHLPKKLHIERLALSRDDLSQRASSVFIRMTSISMPANRRQAFRLRLRAYQAAAFRSFCSRTVCHHIRSTSRCRSKPP